jgi:hypothetical protein
MLPILFYPIDPHTQTPLLPLSPLYFFENTMKPNQVTRNPAINLVDMVFLTVDCLATVTSSLPNAAVSL